ncbi:secondary thiamine-phosphate synthase enzyme YjbQ [Candidatus Micrarchaeota archaeon]|nr:secondary thiamine-phosphate synthase enzyme YjbQ [Candidatus Micrarchaeota archaeon]
MKFNITTKGKYDIVDITSSVKNLVNINEGICVVCVLHTTAGLVVNEFEPNIAEDYIEFFKNLAPDKNWKHNKIDANAEAHLLSTITGSSKTFIVKNNKLILGTWQRILLCEFDGPRNREVIVYSKSE